MNQTIYEKYWEAVSKVLKEKKSESKSDKPRPKYARKSTAKELSQLPPPTFDGNELITQLYQSLGKEWKPGGKNWSWRPDDPKAEEKSSKYREVKLERTIVQQGRQKKQDWTWQMSTASGVENSTNNKKTSIDLVRKNGDGDYTFVELKVESDNPLYALFELLGYTLAYLHARNHDRIHSPDECNYDVLKANMIRLVVLGPERWYKYETRSKQEGLKEYKLEWIAEKVVAGLQSLDVADKPEISFTFKKYPDFKKHPDAIALQAESIIRDAADW